MMRPRILAAVKDLFASTEEDYCLNGINLGFVGRESIIPCIKSSFSILKFFTPDIEAFLWRVRESPLV